MLTWTLRVSLISPKVNWSQNQELESVSLCYPNEKSSHHLRQSIKSALTSLSEKTQSRRTPKEKKRKLWICLVGVDCWGELTEHWFSVSRISKRLNCFRVRNSKPCSYELEWPELQIWGHVWCEAGGGVGGGEAIVIGVRPDLWRQVVVRLIGGSGGTNCRSGGGGWPWSF